MAVVVFIGFSRTFYLKGLFPEGGTIGAPEPFFIIHGVVVTAWFLMLILQPLLITQRKVALHRSLGWAGVVIAAATVVLGIQGAIVAANRPGGFLDVPFPPEQFFVIPFTAMLLFGIFVALAVAYRKQGAHHKRFMLVGTVNLLEAAIIRFPFAFIPANAPLTSFGPALLFIVALIIYDRRTLGKIHPVTLWGGIVVAVSQPLAFVISNTSAWHSFATWMIGFG